MLKATILGVCVLLETGAAMAMPNFTSAACGTAIDVAVQQPFTLTLEENPTTGFRWDVQTDPGLAVTSSDYVQGAATGVGGGGVRHIVLVADSAGTWRLTGLLMRSWLGPQSATQRCEITVRAK